MVGCLVVSVYCCGERVNAACASKWRSPLCSIQLASVTITFTFAPPASPYGFASFSWCRTPSGKVNSFRAGSAKESTRHKTINVTRSIIVHVEIFLLRNPSLHLSPFSRPCCACALPYTDQQTLPHAAGGISYRHTASRVGRHQLSCCCRALARPLSVGGQWSRQAWMSMQSSFAWVVLLKGKIHLEQRWAQPCISPCPAKPASSCTCTSCSHIATMKQVLCGEYSPTCTPCIQHDTSCTPSGRCRS